MKQTLKRLFSFPVNVIASGCLIAWICGVFSCFAADFNDQGLEYNDEPVKVFDFYPPVAEGHEDIYDRFLNGKLIYKPNPNSDEGKVELRISDLEDPLNGTFDLSRCGYTGEDLSISTGYRKGKKPENKYRDEIWICPRFLIEKELSTAAAHFTPIMADWKPEKAPVGLFWTKGSWDDLSWYDCLTTQSMDELSNGDLYKKYMRGWGSGCIVMRRGDVCTRYGIRVPSGSSYFVLKLSEESYHATPPHPREEGCRFA